jgi:mRNA interferase MazF
MMYVFGEVVVVPFPFTNQSGIKKRPAVVISGRHYNEYRQDLVIMAVTSQIRPNLGLGEALVVEWQVAGLLKPSLFKPVFATIEKSLILRSMGILSSSDQHTLRAILTQIMELSPS